MKVLIAGSHGNIGRRLTRLLADAGHEPVAMIRDEAQAQEMRALGGQPLVADLAGDVAHTPQGCDAIVFTAGAGPGSGPEPKQVIDRGGAERLVAAAREHQVARYVMVSTVRADDPTSGPEHMVPYFEAKGQADATLAASGLDFTIVRPGRLTDDPGDGRVAIAPSLPRGGSVTRDDVAAVVAACLQRPDTIGWTFELLDGEVPIHEALDALTGGQGR